MHLIIPILLLIMLLSSVFMGSNVYDSFISGAKKALPLMLKILPFMAAMLCALNVFRDSGALGLLTRIISPVLSIIGIPGDLITLVVLRPFSGNAALALLSDVFSNSGVDTYSGYLASVMLGSTETIFYTVALYFGSIKIQKTRHAVAAAIISGLVSMTVSVILTRMFFGCL